MCGLVHAASHAYHIRFDRPASLQTWDLPSGPLAHHLSILGSICQSNWDLELQAPHLFSAKQSASICQSAGCHASIKKIGIALVHVVLSAFDLISMISRAISQVLENRQAASFAGEHFSRSGKPPR